MKVWRFFSCFSFVLLLNKNVKYVKWVKDDDDNNEVRSAKMIDSYIIMLTQNVFQLQRTEDVASVVRFFMGRIIIFYGVKYEWKRNNSFVFKKNYQRQEWKNEKKNEIKRREKIKRKKNSSSCCWR